MAIDGVKIIDSDDGYELDLRMSTASFLFQMLTRHQEK